MTWVIILLQLLPELIELIAAIIAAIRKKPLRERMPLRRELGRLCRAHLKQRGKEEYVVKRSCKEAESDLEEFLRRIS